MRGFTKAAALLSSTFVSAFVVPNTGPPAVDVKASDPVVQYCTLLHQRQ